MTQRGCPPRDSALFTLALRGEGEGIGDQLYQIQLLYNLGRSCGWDYVHGPLAPPRRNFLGPKVLEQRSAKAFDCHDFLGLSWGEKPLAEAAEPRFIDIDARELFQHLSRTGRPPAIHQPGDDRTGIVRIKMNSWFYIDYKNAPSENPLPLRYQLNLAEKYRQARRRDPVPMPFTRGKIPILLHFRLGDLAWYPEGGEVYFPFAPGCEHCKGWVADTPRYLDALQTVLGDLGAERCEVWVYSDGLPNRLTLAWKLARGFRHKPHRALQQAERLIRFQRQRVSQLRTCGAPVHFRIGNGVALFREAVHAFATAPIAIAARKSGLTEVDYVWESAFPDLGVRDTERLPPVFALNHSPPVAIGKLISDYEIRPWH